MPLLNLTKEPQATPGKRPATFHGRVPTKQDINFALVGVKRVRWWLLVLSLVLIVAAVGAFAKFLVLDRLAEVSAAQAEATRAHSQLEACYARIEDYGELNELYAHYTYSGMTEEELGRVDRVAVMDLLQRVVFPRTQVNTWTLSGNQLSLDIEGSTLQEINVTVQKLLADELVSYCEVHTATTDNKTRREFDMDNETVTASIVVYLEKAEEGTEK